MGIFALISSILSLLPGLIQAGESIYGAIKGQGALKKAAVMGAVAGIVDVVAAQPGNSTTASQKPAILALASGITDTLVAGYNTVDALTSPTAAPIIVDSTPYVPTVFPTVEAGK